jgi:hypothetical protein
MLPVAIMSVTYYCFQRVATCVLCIRCSIRVLDVGCGFGDATLMWAQMWSERYPTTPVHFIALNISAFHVEAATRRLTAIAGGAWYPVPWCSLTQQHTLLHWQPRLHDHHLATQ